MINVYEYMDYRVFLQDFYSCKKENNPNYSYTVLARDAGVSSRGLIKLIVDGKRNLSLKTLPKMVKGVKLNKAEAKYFFTLVRFNQAKNLEEKNNLYNELLSFKGKKKVTAFHQEQYNIYSKWYYSAIYEMLNLSGCPHAGEELYTWLSGKLFNEVTPKQAKDALFDLEKVNLISLTKGKFIQNNESVENPGGEINFAAQLFQKKVIEKSLTVFDRPLSDRNISGLTMAIKSVDIPRAQEFINEFRKNFEFDFCAYSEADHVYQLNVQFYELTDRQYTSSEKKKRDAISQNSDSFKNNKQIILNEEGV